MLRVALVEIAEQLISECPYYVAGTFAVAE
jgi:hypothetical protein